MDQNRTAIAQVKQFGLGKEKTHNSEKGSKRMPKLMRSLHLNNTRPKQAQHHRNFSASKPVKLSCSFKHRSRLDNEKLSSLAKSMIEWTRPCHETPIDAMILYDLIMSSAMNIYESWKPLKQLLHHFTLSPSTSLCCTTSGWFPKSWPLRKPPCFTWRWFQEECFASFAIRPIVIQPVNAQHKSAQIGRSKVKSIQK